MKKINGQLTVDKERGVVYFHDEIGQCLLRLEGIPKLPDEAQIDVRLRSMSGRVEPFDLEGHMMLAELVGLSSHTVKVTKGRSRCVGEGCDLS